MGYRALVVDDEPIIASTLETILRSRGYEAKAVGSGEQALELIAKWRPAVAIVDVILPQLSGIEVGKRLLSDIPECKLLLMSGATRTAELLEQVEKDGYKFEILAKPVHPLVLLEKIATLLPHRQDQPVGLLVNSTGASM